MRIISFVARLTLGLAVFVGLAGLSQPSHATTYYVRVDGGTAAQCTGTTNAAYPGSGTGRACAFNHPYWALPPPPSPSKLASGDTLVIGSGSYMMGYGAPNSTTSQCNTPGTYQCTIANIPSGIDAAHPTTVTGNCSAPPQLWATQASRQIFNLNGVHDIAIKCLDLTDHSECIINYPISGQGISACAGSYPYGTWGYKAIYASGVKNLTLADLDIHGFAEQGLQAGGFSGTTTVTRVKVVGNARAGWNGDLGGSGSSQNSGTMTFTDLTIAWTGCSEDYPVDGGYKGCFGANEGGYGDGYSTGDTGGNYVFIRPQVYNNTQDGLDMLHVRNNGTVTVDGGYFAKNAGNDLKFTGNGTVTNNVFWNYCTWFQDAGYPAGGDSCRAGGGEEGDFNGPGQIQTWAYNTMIGNGNGMFIGNSTAAQSTDEYVFANNIFIGVARNGQQPFFLWVADGTPIMKITYHNNLVWGTRSTTCDGVGIICKDPLLTSETLTGFNPKLLPSSSAIDAADTAYITNHDETGMPRPVGARNDIGAIEYRGQPWLVPDSSPVPAAGGTGQQGAPAYSDPVPPQDGGTSTGGAPVAAPGGGVLSPGYTQPGSRVSMPRQGRVDGARWFTRRDARFAAAHPSLSADSQELVPAAPPRSGARADADTATVPAQAGNAPIQRSYLAIAYDWFTGLYQRMLRH